MVCPSIIKTILTLAKCCCVPYQFSSHCSFECFNQLNWNACQSVVASFYVTNPLTSACSLPWCWRGLICDYRMAYHNQCSLKHRHWHWYSKHIQIYLAVLYTISTNDLDGHFTNGTFLQPLRDHDYMFTLLQHYMVCMSQNQQGKFEVVHVPVEHITITCYLA